LNVNSLFDFCFLKSNLTPDSIISINAEFKSKRTKFKIASIAQKETNQVNEVINYRNKTCFEFIILGFRSVSKSD
jgi:hypothetical protein